MLREAGERNDRDGSFPRDNLARLHQAGLLGLTVPAALGWAESGTLKVVLTRNAVEAVRLATSLAGNHGLSRHNALERCWRDVQCGLVHVPQADSAMVAAGKHVLG